MQLDDTKHKVYIYDLDAELASDSEASDDGRLVFLPDIKKHLRESRIPPVVLANSDGQLAGMDKQMVLYNVPSSLTVPEEQDSVRKAIIETRARTRARLEDKRKKDLQDAQMNGSTNGGFWNTYRTPSPGTSVSAGAPSLLQIAEDDDPDAMDLG